ncbi:DNA mismatch repair protein MutL [Caulifigura coniformis]|uniref:DNA mismatch repair protein MutL n=1 Tax=Caulifigura coniformis TaxID=2527983 RepID=A0A517SL45_9PLAN|nr:DNA mismatch repair endonuclease MutL [Caulifigura coniformis]QDT56845.1 DNA mismatch repair protein MutL [Caulifigura coniformis]
MSSAHTEAAPRIRKLSTALVNKIAAGEVIERPASVVKELLENAIDAGATRIDIECQQGGAELIRIVDDGCGIHPEDIELAITAHATSKLADADDLFRVQTMGFRGEALASISEVSSFRLRTRPADLEMGTEITVEGGVMTAPRPCGAPAGTQIDVRQLFLNTPVRRKFLKSQATEFAHISEQFTRLSLAQPRIHFTLRHNDKLVFELPAVDDLGDRIEQVFGTELRGRMIPIEGDQAGLRLWGFTGHPDESRATRKAQYLFVNGRWIQDRTVQHALTEAYRGLMMVGRQPVCFLFLEVPPDEVDVNVHPTKAEVRFVDPQRLYRLVLSSIRRKFLGLNFESPLQPTAGRSTLAAGAPVLSPELPLFSPSPSTQPPRTAYDSLVEERQRSEFAAWAKSHLETAPPREGIEDLEAAAAALEHRPSDHSPSVWPAPASQTTDLSPGGPPAPRPVTDLPGPDPVPASRSDEDLPRAMQVLDCYLVVETGDAVTLIDQHALHERIMYEQLRRRVLEGRMEVQRLLMPVLAELTPREVGLLLDQTEVLSELGLEVSSLGGRSVGISAYPVLLRRADPVELVRAVVEQIEQAGQKLTRRDLIDSLLHMMACKAAIKAGQRLTSEEIDSLLAQRHLVDDAHHCPHGRPTALTLSRAELDRQFGRLG